MVGARRRLSQRHPRRALPHAPHATGVNRTSATLRSGPDTGVDGDHATTKDKLEHQLMKSDTGEGSILGDGETPVTPVNLGAISKTS